MTPAKPAACEEAGLRGTIADKSVGYFVYDKCLDDELSVVSAGVNLHFFAGEDAVFEKAARRLGFHPAARMTAVHRRDRQYPVESRCGAVAVGSVCLLPPLSSGGARVTSP
jgi:hypothetical protein